MQIGFCDDNIAYLKEAQNIMSDFLTQKKIPGDIITFSQGDELLNYVESSEEKMDLLFMDIDLNETNGIQLTKEINQKLPFCQITYLTNYLHFATDVYQTNHCYFIIKEQLHERLEELFEKLLQNHDASFYNKRIPITSIQQNQIIVFQGEILYLERIRRITYIHTKSITYETKTKLEELLPLFDSFYFVRCHQSFIVSLNAVSELQKADFILKNKKRVPISRTYQNSAKEAFFRWVQMKI